MQHMFIQIRVRPKGPMAAWQDSFQRKLRPFDRAAQAFRLRFRSHSIIARSKCTTKPFPHKFSRLLKGGAWSVSPHPFQTRVGDKFSDRVSNFLLPSGGRPQVRSEKCVHSGQRTKPNGSFVGRGRERVKELNFDRITSTAR